MKQEGGHAAMIQLTPKQAAVLASAAKVLQDLSKQVTPKPEEPSKDDEEDDDEDMEDDEDEEESSTHGAYKP